MLPHLPEQGGLLNFVMDTCLLNKKEVFHSLLSCILSLKF